MAISKDKIKILSCGLLFGLAIGLAVTVSAGDYSDSWVFGKGWLWFKESISAPGKIRANVDEPLDSTNIATKNYVDAASGSGGGSPVIFNTKIPNSGLNLDANCNAEVAGAVAVNKNTRIVGNAIIRNIEYGWIEMDGNSATCDGTQATFRITYINSEGGGPYSEVYDLKASNCGDTRPTLCIKY